MVTLSYDPTFRGQRSKCLIFLKFSKCYSSYRLRSMVMYFGQNIKWVSGYKSYQQFDLKGHVGVTEVKKVKNLKTLLLLQITGYGHVTHVYASALSL